MHNQYKDLSVKHDPISTKILSCPLAPWHSTIYERFTPQLSAYKNGYCARKNTKLELWISESNTSRQGKNHTVFSFQFATLMTPSDWVFHSGMSLTSGFERRQLSVFIYEGLTVHAYTDLSCVLKYVNEGR